MRRFLQVILIFLPAWLVSFTHAQLLPSLSPAVLAQLEQITTASRFTNTNVGLIESAQQELQVAEEALKQALIATQITDKKRYVEQVAHAIDPQFTGGRGPGNGDGLINLMPALVTRLSYISSQPSISFDMSNYAALAVQSAQSIAARAEAVTPIVSRIRVSSDSFAVTLYIQELDEIVSSLRSGSAAQPGFELLSVQVQQLQQAALAMP